MPTLNDYFPFGVWDSSDPMRRFSLDFNENNCIWTERNSKGKSIKATVTVIKQGSQWRVERPNNAPLVLKFLGAPESVIPQILAQNPAPTFMLLELNPTNGEFILAHCNELRWLLKSNGTLNKIEQPGSTPATKKDYTLPRKGNDSAYFKVAKGQVTFDSEGAERGTYHSRYIHWPGGASGVTIGRGYDMKNRTATAIRNQMIAIGLDASVATEFAAAAGLSGSSASTFITKNRTRLGNLTPGQQKRLFEPVYLEMENDVKRICESTTVVDKYGTTNFRTLSQVILTIIVDLRYRGDYTVTSRKFLQPLIVKNDLKGIGREMRRKENWPNVPPDRFDRRITYLSANGG